MILEQSGSLEASLARMSNSLSLPELGEDVRRARRKEELPLLG